MKEFFKTILYTPLYNILMFLVWLVPGNSVGLAIIILTIIIRTLLLPASLKASKAQVKLQALQPKIQKLRNEIKDQQAQGKAMMEMYKKEGVSPFGSCLPMLIQLPIIFVLYRVFTVGLDESRFSLLYSFVPQPENINTYFLGFDLAKPDLWILPIIAGASQFVLTRLTMPPKDANNDKDSKADPMQAVTKQMMYFFPIITVIIARSFPAAIALYWIVTTIFGVIQQIYVNKTIKNSSEMKKEISEGKEDIDEEIEEYEEYKDETNKNNEDTKKDKKKNLMTKMMNKRLKKQEKKTGVQISIRKKK